VGMSASEVNYTAATYDLNVSFSGAVSSGGISSSQDIPEGTEVSPGTVISVSFTGSSATFND
ncbi:MAG: hypothetical protein UCN61_10030, partial [Ruminococcus sp.]|nr:hypothetical protein [Ruminococcus sp.]